MNGSAYVLIGIDITASANKIRTRSLQTPYEHFNIARNFPIGVIKGSNVMKTCCYIGTNLTSLAPPDLEIFHFLSRIVLSLKVVLLHNKSVLWLQSNKRLAYHFYA